MKVLGLCEGRHQIPVSDYIFNSDYFSSENMFDFESMKQHIEGKLQGVDELALYVTGFTPALCEVINYCNLHNIKLTLYHFNRDINDYVKQEMFGGTNKNE